MTTAELFRLLCNLARIGTVTELDIAHHTARVSTGDNTTDWVRWACSRAGDAVTWHAPSLGEQVIILAPCGEMTTATIIGALYSDAHPAPMDSPRAHVITYPDGARFSYDPDQSALDLSGIKTLTINAGEAVNITCSTATVAAKKNITFDSPEVICTHQLTAATFSVTQGGELNGDFTGSMTINGVKPDSHDHGGVESGSSWTQGIK
ncbi:phage baseplate assembly protein V [Serratia marcescens]|uniref:phage baseplate assembly protein V n=1 Tax=Serratia marcescens TaxID=615 RepID=UPI0024C4DBCB|nr:phage baseplate assembly protein V [Serratia marcescens]MDK1707010.1 phage baseplate assembly protein V [Serratia marcescens]